MTFKEYMIKQDYFGKLPIDEWGYSDMEKTWNAAMRECAEIAESFNEIWQTEPNLPQKIADEIRSCET